MPPDGSSSSIASARRRCCQAAAPDRRHAGHAEPLPILLGVLLLGGLAAAALGGPYRGADVVLREADLALLVQRQADHLTGENLADRLRRAPSLAPCASPESPAPAARLAARVEVAGPSVCRVANPVRPVTSPTGEMSW